MNRKYQGAHDQEWSLRAFMFGAATQAEQKPERSFTFRMEVIQLIEGEPDPCTNLSHFEA